MKPHFVSPTGLTAKVVIAIASWLVCSATGAAIDLTQYKTPSEYAYIDGVIGASGLTYKPASSPGGEGTLFTIINKPPVIYELSLAGKNLTPDGIELLGFDDTEGITHIQDNTFAVVEEARGTITLIEIDGSGKPIRKSDSTVLQPALVVSDSNKGLEGIAFVQGSGSEFLYVTLEAPKVWRVDTPRSSPTVSDTDIVDTLRLGQLPDDISGLHFDQSSGTLLVLSDDSTELYSLDPSAPSVAPTSLNGRLGSKQMPQAEGVAMDESGRIYLVSEHEPPFLLKWTCLEKVITFGCRRSHFVVLTR